MRSSLVVLTGLLAAAGLGAGPASAFTRPFTFHCTGDACRAMGFADEGFGCLIYTNRGRAPIRLTLGPDGRVYDLAPGQTISPLTVDHCYGYYDGGEQAVFLPPSG